MKKRTTVAELEKQLASLGQRHGELAGRLSNHRLELDGLDDYKQALGPMWKTQAGHCMPITLLSTSHLQRLSSGNWVKDPETLRRIWKELDRRGIDDEWRAKDAPRKDPCIEELRRKVCELDKTLKTVAVTNSVGRQVLEDRIVELEDDVIVDEDDDYVGKEFISHIVFPQECKHEFADREREEAIARSHDPLHWKDLTKVAQERTEAEAVLPDDVVDLYGKDMVASIARGPVTGVDHIRVTRRPKNEKIRPPRKPKRKSRIAAAWRAFLSPGYR